MAVLSTILVFAALTHAVAVLVVLEGRQRRRGSWWAIAPMVAAAGLAAWVFAPSHITLLLAALTVAVLTGGLRSWARGFHTSGVLLWVSFLALLFVGLPWSVWFVIGLHISELTKALVLSGMPLLVLTGPAMLVRTFENWEVVCRARWTRPQHPLLKDTRIHHPRVSIHVPAHCEPPEVVNATLDTLAGLDYPNFEVVVIDNNTSDERLWRPVQAHCDGLGERFRFLHVEGITGAKAGALNYALAHTDPNAELIAVVDADYHAAPDFLAGTVGFFDDPVMGFVQSPHAYRDFKGNPYLTMCNWEYAYFFATGMVSLNERDAAITVGTMCVIRREALEKAGGWAEWCLTEDSELAVRIHALGYSSVYLNHVYGRGLIPPTFAGYKTQRFRWTYGPVQEFKHHWRFYLPRAWRRPSEMSPGQRIHHVTHGLYGIGVGMGVVALPLAAAVMVSMLTHHETIPLPFPLWAAMSALLFSTLALRWHIYRSVLGASKLHTIGAWVASNALAYVIIKANLSAFIGRQVPWQRTNKFRPHPQKAGGVGSALTELLLSALCLGIAAAAALLRQSGIMLMLSIGFAIQGFIFLSSPAMAVLAELCLCDHTTTATSNSLYSRFLAASRLWG